MLGVLVVCLTGENPTAALTVRESNADAVETSLRGKPQKMSFHFVYKPVFFAAVFSRLRRRLVCKDVKTLTEKVK